MFPVNETCFKSPDFSGQPCLISSQRYRTLADGWRYLHQYVSVRSYVVVWLMEKTFHHISPFFSERIGSNFQQTTDPLLPGLFGTPPERLHNSGHTMGGESKQKVAWQLCHVSPRVISWFITRVSISMYLLQTCITRVSIIHIYIYIYRLKAGGSPELPGTLSLDM